MYTSHCLFCFGYPMETVCFVKLTKKAIVELIPLLMTYVGGKIVKSTDFQIPVWVINNKFRNREEQNPKN